MLAEILNFQGANPILGMGSLSKLFKEEKEAAKEEQLTLYCDYENGLITREELNEQIGESGLSCYLSARNTFNAKYGFYPIKVPVYELSAFEAEEEEKIAA